MPKVNLLVARCPLAIDQFICSPVLQNLRPEIRVSASSDSHRHKPKCGACEMPKNRLTLWLLQGIMLGH